MAQVSFRHTRQKFKKRAWWGEGESGGLRTGPRSGETGRRSAALASLGTGLQGPGGVCNFPPLENVIVTPPLSRALEVYRTQRA